MNAFLIATLMYVVTLLPLNLYAYEGEETKTVSVETSKKEWIIKGILIAASLASFGLNIKLYLDKNKLNKQNDSITQEKDILKVKADALRIELLDKNQKIQKYIQENISARDLLKRMGSFLLKIKNFRNSHEDIMQSFTKMKEGFIFATQTLDEANAPLHEKVKQSLEELENKLKEFKGQLNLSEWVPLSIYNEDAKHESQMD